MQLDGIVVRVVGGAHARSDFAHATLLHRHFELARHHDVQLHVPQDRPEYRQGGRDHGDVDFKGGEDDRGWAVPCRIEGWVGGCLGTDNRGQAPYGEDACAVVWRMHVSQPWMLL